MPYRASLPNALNEWLTDREVAAMLNISERTLPQWRYLGKFKNDLPHYKIGRSVRYRRTDVEAFVAHCRVGGITLPDQSCAIATLSEQSANSIVSPVPNFTAIPAAFFSHANKKKDADT